jgi:hypothetical protein
MKRLASLLAAIAFCGLAPACALATEYWLGGVDPVIQRVAHKDVMRDYMGLVNDPDAWRAGATRVSVLKVSAQFVLFGEPDMIRGVFNNMHARHIKMAVEMGSVVRLDNCGGGEGYAPPDMADKMGKKLRDLGVTLDYMALDEPVWYGHEITRGMTPLHQPFCAYPLKVVAQRSAMSIKAMRKYFPAVQVGIIDVVSTSLIPASQLAREYGEFASLLQDEIGGRLAFFHCDIAWRTDWQAVVPPLKAEMRRLRIPFGLIVNGGPLQPTSEAWVDVALRRLRMFEANPALRPDQIVVQSWEDLPTKMLPETEAGTATYLLLQAQRAAGR